MKPPKYHWAWPAITYVSSLKIPKQLYESEFKSEQLLREGEITQLFGNTRLMLSYNRSNGDDVYLSLWYSRMITSEEDYRSFYGGSINEKLRTRPDFQFDSMVAAEIESLQPLPPLFEMAYARCKASSVSQKMVLNCIMGVGQDKKYEEVVRGNLSLPAVMIGDAAHGVPESCSPGTLNETISDALILGRRIIERYHDDSAFASIPKDFYYRRCDMWRVLPGKWAEKWMTAHGYENSMPSYRSYRDYWVKQSAPSREPDHRAQFILESKDMDPNVLLFKQHEEERWRKVEQRMHAYRSRQLAYKSKSTIQSTKMVVRYLDSRHQEGVDTNEHQSMKKKSSTKRREKSSSRPHSHS